MFPVLVGIGVLVAVSVFMILTGMCCRAEHKGPKALLEPPDHRHA